MARAFCEWFELEKAAGLWLIAGSKCDKLSEPFW
jgi:hypothetical protein